MAKVLQGGKLAGGNPKNGRVDGDFYATNPLAVEMLMDNYKFNEGSFLEPCVGNGNVLSVIKARFPASEIVGVDIIDRGYPNTIIHDFLTYPAGRKFDNIITNPPYALAKEFVEKGMELLDDKGKMAMFLKIQFLEAPREGKCSRSIRRNMFMYSLRGCRLGIMESQRTIMVKDGRRQCVMLGLCGKPEARPSLW